MLFFQIASLLFKHKYLYYCSKERKNQIWVSAMERIREAFQTKSGETLDWVQIGDDLPPSRCPCLLVDFCELGTLLKLELY